MDVAGGEFGHGRAGFDGRRPQVRQQDDVVELEQTGVDCRLVLEDVEPGAGDLAAAQRLDERGLVDDRPAGRVDEVGAGFHRAQRLGVDEVMRRPGLTGGDERAVQRDDVCGCQEFGQLEASRAELGRSVGGHVARARVDDVHPEGPGAPGHRDADPAGADDAERLAAQVHAEQVEHAPLPRGAGPDDALALAEAARRHEHEPEGGVGGRVGEHAGGVRRDDAAPGARGDVDVVVADGDIGDDLELVACRIEEFVVDAVRDHRDDPVRTSDASQGLLAGGSLVRLPRVDVVRGPQEVHGRLRDPVRDDDSGLLGAHRGSPSV